MFGTNEQDELLQFVMASDERKRLALAIIAAQNALTRKLILDFVRKLHNRLHEETQKLGAEWIVINGWSNNGDRDLGLSKKNWNESFKIVLQPDHKNANIRFGIGVWCESYSEPDRAIKALDQLRAKRPGEEKPSPHWPYCFAVKRDYVSWESPADLERLTIGSDASNYFFDEIVSLAKEAENIIDDLMCEPAKD